MLFILIALIFAFLVAQLIYSAYYFQKARILAKAIYANDLEIGKKNNPTLKVLVGGDSIATGVGATNAQTSTAGRLANYLAKSNYVVFKNKATNGAKMADLLNETLPSEKQDLIILIVSSNDLLYLTNFKKFEMATKKVLEKYSKLTKKLIIIGPGRIDSCIAIPLPLRLIYKIQGPKYASIIKSQAKHYPNIVYLKPDWPPQGTFSSDKFHPNDEGHKVWFERIKKAI